MKAWKGSWKPLTNNKALSLIGLATKAGKTASGEFSTEKAVKCGKGYLVIVAGDASANTQKKFRNMCEFYEVPMYVLADKESLGRAMGKEFRASLAVLDANFSAAIEKALMTGNAEGGREHGKTQGSRSGQEAGRRE